MNPDRLELENFVYGDTPPTRPDNYKDPEHVWDNVTEKSEQLFILNFNPKKKSWTIQSQQIYLDYPTATLINTFDYPPNSIVSLINLPKNLPNLKYIWIFSPNFDSLQGFPKFLPKLTKLAMTNTLISDLTPLPSSIPTLETIGIVTFRPHIAQIKSLNGFPTNLPNLKELNLKTIPIKSLKYLPESLPKVEKIKISGTNITNLQHLPNDTPNLKELILSHNNLTSLKGMPLILPSIQKIDVQNNYLMTAEFLPEKTGVNCISYFNNNQIRTLHGINDRFFKHFLSKVSRCLNLCPKGMEIIENYNPPIYYPDEIVNEAKVFYKKSSHELAQQYISDLNPLNEGEIERLIWEADLTDRNLIQNNVSANDLILIEICRRFRIPLNSDFSLLR